MIQLSNKIKIIAAILMFVIGVNAALTFKSKKDTPDTPQNIPHANLNYPADLPADQLPQPTPTPNGAVSKPDFYTIDDVLRYKPEYAKYLSQEQYIRAVQKFASSSATMSLAEYCLVDPRIIKPSTNLLKVKNISKQEVEAKIGEETFKIQTLGEIDYDLRGKKGVINVECKTANLSIVPKGLIYLP